MTKAVLNSGGDGAAGGRAAVAVTILFAALYTGARLWRLDASCLWFDEIFSVHAARHDWAGLFSFVAADLIHPPLFYALLKIWTGVFGASLYALRLFPALTAIACIVPFLLLARELRFSRAETNLALLLLAVNGYLIKYAQEVRMYSLLLCLSLCSFWLFVKFFNRASVERRDTSVLFVVNLLLIYTHYFGWLVVAAEAFFLLLKRRDRLAAFTLNAAALALCFAPWVYSVLRAAGEGGGVGQNIGWMPRPRLSDLAGLLALLQEPFYFRQSSDEPLFARIGAPLGFLLLAAPAAVLVWRTLGRGKTNDAGSADGRESAVETEGRQVSISWLHASVLWLIVACFVPVTLAFVASRVLPHSVWGTRHLIIVAVPYTLLCAVGLNRLRPSWLKISALVVLGCWFFFAGIGRVVRGDGVYIWCAWEGLAAQLADAESGTQGKVRIYAFEDLVAYHLWFALDTAGEKKFDVAVIKRVPGLTEDPAYFLPRRFDAVAVRDETALDGDVFWLAFRDVRWDEGRPPLNILKERGYRVEKTFETGAQGQHAFLVLVRREGAR
ncbi:MAG: glycosyltransferase family 39 protein [Pyrinomonadaceae bacterium]